jgi:hypothetical protein
MSDFGLDVSEVRVNGKKAQYAKRGTQELEITPAGTLAKGRSVSVVVRYAGKPSELKIGGWTAWARTPDGGVAAQEPESAVWWFPSNDHPLDKVVHSGSIGLGILSVAGASMGRDVVCACVTRMRVRSLM